LENIQGFMLDHLPIHSSNISDSQFIVIILPALGTPAKFYKQLYKGVIKADLGAVLLSLKGEGLLKKAQLISKSNFGYVEFLNDLEKIITFLKKNYPDKEIITIGHSIGGQLACLYNCHENSFATASIVIAGGLVWYQSWNGFEKIKMLFATQFLGLISKFLGWFPGKTIGFGGNQPKNLMLDWSRNARTGTYKLINQKIDYEATSKNVKSRFLGIVIDKDMYAPYASTKNLLDKFSASDRDIYTLTKDDFNNITPNHLNWLKEPQPVIDKITSWLHKKGITHENY